MQAAPVLQRYLQIAGLLDLRSEGALVNRFSFSSLGSRRIFAIPLMAWVVLASASLIWNIHAIRQNTLANFVSEAQTLTQVALSTILWAAHHERVYVPLTEWVPMEPYFAKLPEMEVVTAGGLRLTRMSHYAIVRQVAEQANFQGWGRKSIRMTSLQPTNPVNEPDDWERETLKLFEAGQTERFAVIGTGADALLVYMVPIRSTAQPLPSPAGLMQPPISGGLSVIESAASRLALIRPQIVSIVVTHAVAFVAVATAMLLLLARLRRQWLDLERLSREQQRIIAKLAESEAKLEEMAVTDELTGLKNRRGFFLLADQQTKAANRENIKVSFIFIDLDGMKAVNDQYGHGEGDKALVATANILRNTFRESDVIARLGGDEFAVMLTDADQSNGRGILDRLQKNVHEYNLAAKNDYLLALSAGIVNCNSGKRPFSLQHLLKRADELMYETKRRKKIAQAAPFSESLFHAYPAPTPAPAS
jgi:diguanylate cyclase (GGDEF)-like protein